MRRTITMASTKEVHKLEYSKGGVQYTIHVEESENGSRWGTWNCHDCNVGGSTHKNASSIDDAVSAAKSDLDLHHTANHSA
jgi:hypothetical protein